MWWIIIPFLGSHLRKLQILGHIDSNFFSKNNQLKGIFVHGEDALFGKSWRSLGSKPEQYGGLPGNMEKLHPLSLGKEHNVIGRERSLKPQSPQFPSPTWHLENVWLWKLTWRFQASTSWSEMEMVIACISLLCHGKKIRCVKNIAQCLAHSKREIVPWQARFSNDQPDFQVYIWAYAYEVQAIPNRRSREVLRRDCIV